MDCLRFSNATAATRLFNERFIGKSKTTLKNNVLVVKAKLNDDCDPLFQTAANAAALRFRETHRPGKPKPIHPVYNRTLFFISFRHFNEHEPIGLQEPLFVDPYAGCFVPPNVQMDMKKYSHHYCLATKFIDDKLLRTVNHIDGLKQVVLLTDGMDTRPYRLNWPTSTILFDVSPERVFKRSAEKLGGVGAKIPRSCLYLHVPLESSSIQQNLRAKGFNGNRPSIWAIQGLPVMTLASFEEMLFTISSLAVNGSFFLGELPAWLTETEIGNKSTTEKWMDKLFMSNGFRVSTISYNEVASSLGKELAPGYYKNILFVAEQLRFSDDQMETWRREFQRVEEGADEEGFEEL